MTIKEFSNKYDLASFLEIEKVARCFYFLSRTQGVKSFSLDDVNAWFADLGFAVPNRTRLKRKLSASRDFIRASSKNHYKLHPNKMRALEEEFKDETFDQVELPKSKSTTFVHLSRIAELEAIKSSEYDLKKVIQFCRELNAAHSSQSYLSIIMLTRSLIDHVPPLFGAKTFAQVASSYGGTKSFKGSMQNLDNSSRNIADSHLHSHIRKTEVLPVINQVDFSPDIDVLLAEIVVITTKREEPTK